MTWEITLHDEVNQWYLDICEKDPETADRIEEALDELALRGPSLGRPLVDRIHHSRILHNLKELRPAYLATPRSVCSSFSIPAGRR